MRVLVAGATGAVGLPTVRALLAAGHEVAGTTRSRERAATLERLGTRPVLMNALDADSVRGAVLGERPEAIVQLLTALPGRGPTRASHLQGTNRLRIEGTRNLIAAARDAERRYVSESIILGYGHTGERVATESDPFAAGEPGDRAFEEPLRALASLEEQVLGFGGIVLRFGLYYGDTGSTRYLEKLARRGLLLVPHGEGVVPWIHVEDAAAAVVSALERGSGPNVYNIVDDEPIGLQGFASALARAVGGRSPKRMPGWMARLLMPYVASGLSVTVRVSNEKARRELGWEPRYPTVREGLGIPPSSE